MQISWKTRSKLYGVCLEAWTHCSWGKRSPLEIVSAIAKPLMPTILCQTSSFGHLFHCIPPNLRVVVTQLWKAAQGESQLGYGTAQRMHGKLLLKKELVKIIKKPAATAKCFQCNVNSSI